MASGEETVRQHLLGKTRNQFCISKVIVVGDSKVGKSSMLSQFTERKIPKTYSPTIGVDFVSAPLQLSSGIIYQLVELSYTFATSSQKMHQISLEGNSAVRLQLWDISGDPRFRSIVGSYFLRAQAVMLVYDVTSVASFQGLHRWIEDIEQKIFAGPNQIPVLVVGNKCDAEKREVTRDLARSWAFAHGFLYMVSPDDDDDDDDDASSSLYFNQFFKIKRNVQRSLVPTLKSVSPQLGMCCWKNQMNGRKKKKKKGGQGRTHLLADLRWTQRHQQIQFLQ